jgi:hypothetical protein
VLPLFDAGVARPVIDRRFALDDIAEAHRHMEANANVGKILVDVTSTSFGSSCHKRVATFRAPGGHLAAWACSGVQPRAMGADSGTAPSSKVMPNRRAVKCP